MLYNAQAVTGGQEESREGAIRWPHSGPLIGQLLPSWPLIGWWPGPRFPLGSTFTLCGWRRQARLAERELEDFHSKAAGGGWGCLGWASSHGEGNV